MLEGNISGLYHNTLNPVDKIDIMNFTKSFYIQLVYNIKIVFSKFLHKLMFTNNLTYVLPSLNVCLSFRGGNALDQFVFQCSKIVTILHILKFNTRRHQICISLFYSEQQTVNFVQNPHNCKKTIDTDPIEIDLTRI